MKTLQDIIKESTAVSLADVVERFIRKTGTGYMTDKGVFILKTQHGKNKWKIDTRNNHIDIIKNGKSVHSGHVTNVKTAMNMLGQKWDEFGINSFDDI